MTDARFGRRLGALIDRPARIHKQKTAVSADGVDLSWGEVHDRVGRAAGALVGSGVRRGDRVAVLSFNSHRYFELYFALAEIGAVIVPLNYRLALGELEYCAADSGSKLLLADTAHLAEASALIDLVDPLEALIALDDQDYESRVAGAAAVEPDSTAEDEIVAIFYTGGTTGTPKGVALTHRNLCEGALNVVIAMGYLDTDVYLHAGPMFHLADGCGSLANAWLGGRHVFIPRFTPGDVLDAVERWGVTTLTLVPTMYQMLMDDPGFDPARLDSLRRCFYSASPMPTDLLERVMANFPCEIAQGYGMTETSARLTSLTAEDHRRFASPAAAPDERKRLGSAGREIVGVEVRVVNEDGERCQTNEVGEITTRGPNVMRGYWGLGEATKIALRDGWMHTGDLAYVDDDGYVFIVDRSKDMIITGGENVYSVEVENALYSHPDVVEAAVIGVADETWGERVHAVVVVRPGSSVRAEALIDHCRNLIAGYKVPRSIDFAESLPKSGPGKMLKRRLRDEHGGPS